MKNQKGFSLVELLVVVIIIAIIAAIAIPNLLASRRAANEASAISSMRTLHSAQATYQATIGNNTDYAITLAELGTAAGGNLIDPALAAASATATAKSGYIFAVNGANQIYCSTAQPAAAGTTGVHGFAGSERGVIYSYAAAPAAATCPATGVFVVGAGAAIQ